MKVLATDTATGRTRTMTTRLVALRPGAADLVDAGFVLALVVLALLGFATTFDSARYLVVGLVGTVLGILLAHVCAVLRWHWAVPLVPAALAYLAFGGIVAAQDGLLGGVVPTPATLAQLAGLVVTGWKDLLTTLPPLDGDGPYVVLAYLLGLLGGVGGFGVARRSRAPWTAVAVPGLLLAAVILLGTYEPAALLPQGLGFAALSFGWMAVRAQRRHRLAGTGGANLTRLGLGAGVLLVALVGGWALGPSLTPSTTPRLVLRSFVEPPVDLPSYTSPLAGFPKYSAEPDHDRLWDTELLRVSSSAPVSWLRIAVLDNYSGITWNAISADSGSVTTAFQRIGSSIPGATSDLVDTTITIEDGYAAVTELTSWLPGTGRAQRVTFEGTDAEDHQRSFRYNLDTGQGLVPDGLRAGDVIVESAEAPRVVTADTELTPGGSPVVGEAGYGFLSSELGQLVSDPSAPAGERLRAAMATLAQGYYSDGSGSAEEQWRYPPGHDQGRLLAFLAEPPYVGSDEQYAATVGLLASQLGFPARVVFGAQVPADGGIKGQHIMAWVEVQLADGQWWMIPPTDFTPPRDRTPDEIPPQEFQDSTTTAVPPPAPVRPPGAFDSWFEVDTSKLATEGPLGQVLAILLLVLRWVGPPLAVIALVVGGITGAKAWRRRRRRVRGPVTAKVAAGWREALDVARDLGHKVPLDATRQEQTLVIGRVDFADLAGSADRVIFGPGEPTDEAATAYWAAVRKTRKGMLAEAPWWRRWRARLSLRTFLPASNRSNGLGLSRLPWRTAMSGAVR